MATEPVPREPRRPSARQRDQNRRVRAAGGEVPGILLWIGILAGPVVFALVRLSGLLLLTGSCRRIGIAALGIPLSDLLMAVITILGVLIAATAGLLSWRIWQQNLEPDNRSGESLRATPFWALGGVILSSTFGIAALLTGGLALALSTPCVS